MGTDLPLWVRRLIGLIWLAVWTALLYLVVRPWSDLGGLVSERMRWLEWTSLWAGLAIGSSVGEIVRGHRPRRGSAGRAGQLRWLWYPVALVATTGMLLLSTAGHDDPAGIVLTAFLAYTATALTSFLRLGRFCRSGEAEQEPGIPERAD